MIAVFRNEERISVFASQDALQFLADSEQWYADGIFRVYPEIFFQLYTMHGQRDGIISLSMFSLLPKKTKTLTIDYLNSYSNS